MILHLVACWVCTVCTPLPATYIHLTYTYIKVHSYVDAYVRYPCGERCHIMPVGAARSYTTGCSILDSGRSVSLPRFPNGLDSLEFSLPCCR
ncbi:hypothetical protein BDV36DRAFT_250727 [Aspergillus pseudocaelatus]|uniref:Secreted protein n=1 Tax=Aspergillus pseudocaelatus TaxID=1825620 RepID=A0ABQ6WS78_9EURO|nr:hypothetical protein BDV36DRAFT_250727 [Aspergillus pseudocaelatus]